MQAQKSGCVVPTLDGTATLLESCQSCNAGEYSDEGATECTTCTAGKYAGAGDPVRNCPAGQFDDDAPQVFHRLTSLPTLSLASARTKLTGHEDYPPTSNCRRSTTHLQATKMRTWQSLVLSRYLWSYGLWKVMMTQPRTAADRSSKRCSNTVRKLCCWYDLKPKVAQSQRTRMYARFYGPLATRWGGPMRHSICRRNPCAEADGYLQADDVASDGCCIA